MGADTWPVNAFSFSAAQSCANRAPTFDPLTASATALSHGNGGQTTTVTASDVTPFATAGEFLRLRQRRVHLPVADDVLLANGHQWLLLVLSWDRPQPVIRWDRRDACPTSRLVPRTRGPARSPVGEGRPSGRGTGAARACLHPKRSDSCEPRRERRRRRPRRSLGMLGIRSGRPVAWLGSTMIGRWLWPFTLGTAAMSSMFRVLSSNSDAAARRAPRRYCPRPARTRPT